MKTKSLVLGIIAAGFLTHLASAANKAHEGSSTSEPTHPKKIKNKKLTKQTPLATDTADDEALEMKKISLEQERFKPILEKETKELDAVEKNIQLSEKERFAMIIKIKKKYLHERNLIRQEIRIQVQANPSGQ